MSKLKIGVVFGGKSTEHDVSIVSGTSVIKNLDKEKYEITPIYISKEGKWYRYIKPIQEIEVLEIGKEIEEKEEINDLENVLKNFDVIFPVLHGLGGEDGSIQGMLELFGVPYVGCGILASSVGMDKVYTKIIFDKANIKQAKYEYIKKYKEKYIYINKNFDEENLTIEEICAKIEKNLKYPVFVKPSNSGSSVGITKANNTQELSKAIEYAGKYDKKILIEQGLIGKEVECAVLGNEEVISSCVGEIKPAEEFYSFDAKYKNSESKTLMPADLSKEMSNEIRKLAIKAFKAIDGKGLSRVDFFANETTEEIYINEINTLPGFTQISMYPKLFETVGIPYSELLDKLITLALEKKMSMGTEFFDNYLKKKVVKKLRPH